MNLWGQKQNGHDSDAHRKEPVSCGTDVAQAHLIEEDLLHDERRDLHERT